MQTDSLLTEADRKMLARWKEHRSLEAQVVSASRAAQFANEIERLEEEKHRLGDSIRSIDDERNDANDRCATTRDALTAARAEVQRLRGEIDAEKIASTYWQDQYNIRNDVAISVGDQLAAARAEVQRLRDDMKAVEKGNSIMGLVAEASQKEIDKLKGDNRKWKAEAQRLREELAKGHSFTVSYEVSNAMDANDKLRNENRLLRMERDKLLADAEKDRSARVEWQAVIDKMEAENTRISNQLRLALILSDPGKVDSVMERIEKLESDASRVALLEGRIQGIAEAAKERLDSHDFRLRALEANGWSGIPVTVATNLPPFNSGYVDGNPNAEGLILKAELR